MSSECWGNRQLLSAAAARGAKRDEAKEQDHEDRDGGLSFLLKKWDTVGGLKQG